MDDGAAPAVSVLRIADYCGALAATPWPRAPSARRELLHRFEILRSHCMEHAGFLATLGALWLEEGEPAQALVWLERALLLNPDHLGALADHSLALAALGDTTARDALAQLWSERADVPPALRLRLQGKVALPTVRSAAASAAAQRPANTVDGWVFYREAALLTGYESNLDHSPRLNELTLTPPDGPISLPLDSPLKPRSALAMVAELSWQMAYSPLAGMIVQTGLQGSARRAPAERETDWHHVQWAAGVSQQWGQWRGQLHGNATWIGGPLNEAFRLVRLGASVDREAIGCSHRVSLESEMRSHQVTRSADGRSLGGQWSLQCPWPGSTTWSWGAAARHNADRPSDPSRPGGVQRQSTFGLRAGGPLNNGTRLDISVRIGSVTDSEGYSPLLENNAIRRMNQTQLSLELARPVPWPWLGGAEAQVQVQALRQGSNLALFNYRGFSVYGGLRWRW